MQYGGESREKSPGFFAEAENREPFPKRKDFGFDAGKLTWQDGSCATQLHPARFGASLLSGKNVDEGGRKGGGEKIPK